MFYLKFFLGFFKSRPFASSIYIFSTFFMTFSFVSDELSQDLTKRLFEIDTNYNYFNVLVPSDLNLKMIKSKMESLPGVGKVKVIKSKKLKSSVENLISDINVSLPDNLTNVKFNGLKVIYDLGVELRTMELIQEFLKKLVGQEKLSMTQIKEHRPIESKNRELKKMIRENFHITLSFITFIMWVISLKFFKEKFYLEASIVENFQRKSMIGLKSILLGTVILIFAMVIILNFFYSLKMSYLITLFISAIFSLLISTRLKRWNY